MDKLNKSNRNECMRAYTHACTRTHAHTPCPDRMVKTVWMQWRHSRCFKSCRDIIIFSSNSAEARLSVGEGPERSILTPDWMWVCSTLSRSSKNSRFIRWAKLTGSDIKVSMVSKFFFACVCVCHTWPVPPTQQVAAQTSGLFSRS